MHSSNYIFQKNRSVKVVQHPDGSKTQIIIKCAIKDCDKQVFAKYLPEKFEFWDGPKRAAYLMQFFQAEDIYCGFHSKKEILGKLKV